MEIPDLTPPCLPHMTPSHTFIYDLGPIYKSWLYFPLHFFPLAHRITHHYTNPYFLLHTESPASDVYTYTHMCVDMHTHAPKYV